MADESWRGKVGALAGDEVDAFLAEGRIARLGCLDADGWPYVVPSWYQYADGGFWIIPRERSVWAGYLARDGRGCAVCWTTRTRVADPPERESWYQGPRPVGSKLVRVHGID